MSVEWVDLGVDGVIVASSRSAWVHRPQFGELTLAGQMPRSLPGTVATTRHLLDGVIAAAEGALPTWEPPTMTTRVWAWQLVTQRYVALNSVKLLGEVVQRFLALGRSDLAAFAHDRFEDERGHVEFPLADLQALGYDAIAVVQEVSPDCAAVPLIEFARGCVEGDYPVDFLGYMHAMERHVIRVSARCFSELERVLPSGVEAASGLRAHASELDVDHVDEAVLFFAGLPAEDRTRIALACYRTAQIRNEPGSNQHPSEAELEDSLDRFRCIPGSSRRSTDQDENQGVMT